MWRQNMRLWWIGGGDRVFAVNLTDNFCGRYWIWPAIYRRRRRRFSAIFRNFYFHNPHKLLLSGPVAHQRLDLYG